MEDMKPYSIDQLYRQYGPSVYRRALNILGSEQEAQEAMQEVFVTLLTKGESFRGDSSLMTWLYSVTTNLCLNQIRNRKRRAMLLSARYRDLHPEDRPHPELVHIVANLLDCVPTDQAQVAIYYYFDDMTQEEISTMMGCSRRKVGDLLERFRSVVAGLEHHEKSLHPPASLSKNKAGGREK